MRLHALQEPLRLSRQRGQDRGIGAGGQRGALLFEDHSGAFDAVGSFGAGATLAATFRAGRAVPGEGLGLAYRAEQRSLLSWVRCEAMSQ